MCGRFAFYQEIEPLAEDLGAVDLTDGAVRARYNIPPTASIVVVTESVEKDSGEVLRALRIARWGLLPPFAKDESFSSRTFNARRETLADKPSFRGSMARYRAVIPISGYYEWERRGTAKTPHYITNAQGGPLWLAGLVSWWKGPGGHEGPAASQDGQWLLSATIITREAVGPLAAIHDRSPVMLRREELDAWLDPDMEERAEAQRWILEDSRLLGPDDLAEHVVDARVGTVGTEGPDLIAPAALDF